MAQSAQFSSLVATHRYTDPKEAPTQTQSQSPTRHTSIPSIASPPLRLLPMALSSSLPILLFSMALLFSPISSQAPSPSPKPSPKSSPPPLPTPISPPPALSPPPFFPAPLASPPAPPTSDLAPSPSDTLTPPSTISLPPSESPAPSATPAGGNGAASLSVSSAGCAAAVLATAIAFGF